MAGLGRLLLNCILAPCARRGGPRLDRAISRNNNAVNYEARKTMILEYMTVGDKPELTWHDRGSVSQVPTLSY